MMAAGRENVCCAATRLCGLRRSNKLRAAPSRLSIPHLFKPALNLTGVLQRTPGDTSEPSEAPVRCNAALGEEAANRIC